MTGNDAWSIASSILISLGGGTVIIYVFSNWLGRIWANRLMESEKAKHSKKLEELRNDLVQETESYKLKLKKSEFIFEKEFEAASDLVALIRGILPRLAYPEMDWHEACDFIALDFGKIEHKLDKYLTDHGAILNEEIIDLIVSCSGIAGQNKFETEGNNVTETANEAANTLYEKIKAAEKKLLQKVHGQVSI